jgi:poly(3-hydroxybutyrate) depolymerase
LLEENYCIDTTRVFVTGFSFGAMFTNSLAWDFQDRIRAVAVYATAAYNIYLPQNKGKPIAWMAVHGRHDRTCEYGTDRGAKNLALETILKNNSAEGKDALNEKKTRFKEIPDNTAGHLCYDFEDVDPRFPVKFCSWNGDHQWTAHDGPQYREQYANWQETWVPEEVHKWFEQF